MKKNLFFALVALVLVSCKSDDGRFLVSATGSAYQCLVVCDDRVKDAVKDTMEAEMYALPQIESYFDVSRVPEEHFDSYLKASRNILRIDIDGRQYTKVKTIMTQDVWATPQAYVRINAPSKDAFLAYWEKNGAYIREWFVREEISRYMRFIKVGLNESAQNWLKKQRYKMYIPSDYDFVQDTTITVNNLDVTYMRCCHFRTSDKHDLIKNIMVYTYPYTSQEQFSNDSITAMRDMVCKRLLGSQIDGSYQAVEWKHFPPVSRYVRPVNDTTGGFYAVETRGLFKTVNGLAMGGPFVSLTRLDQVAGRVVHAEAFIYNPGEKKRNNLRQMESILYSIRMPNEK